LRSPCRHNTKDRSPIPRARRVSCGAHRHSTCHGAIRRKKANARSSSMTPTSCVSRVRSISRARLRIWNDEQDVIQGGESLDAQIAFAANTRDRHEPRAGIHHCGDKTRSAERAKSGAGRGI
jgi:hypothetical protein